MTRKSSEGEHVGNSESVDYAQRERERLELNNRLMAEARLNGYDTMLNEVLAVVKKIEGQPKLVMRLSEAEVIKMATSMVNSMWMAPSE